MNPELQKSLHVSAMSSAIDSYMLMILLIMVAAGILGGIANCYLNERQSEAGRRDWGKYLTLGVIAALTVPLFLNMISSNLLEAARTRPVDFFVFGGFCLIYVVASRRVFESVASRLLGQMDQMKREMGEIKGRHQDMVSLLVREDSVVSGDAGLPPSSVKSETSRESLSYNDIEILRTLAEEHYVFGNLVGLTDKTGLARDVVSSRLTVLKSLGMIETRINDKGVLHWRVAAKGQQVLGEALSGQDNH